MTDSLEILVICHGVYRLGIATHQISRLLAMPARNAEWDAPSDILNTRLQCPPPILKNPRRLVLKTAHGAMTVTVEEPQSMRTLPASALRPLPPLIAAALKHSPIYGFALDEEGMLLLVDFDRE